MPHELVSTWESARSVAAELSEKSLIFWSVFIVGVTSSNENPQKPSIFHRIPRELTQW